MGVVEIAVRGFVNSRYCQFKSDITLLNMFHLTN